MFLSVQNTHAYIDNRVSCKNAVFHGFLYALLDTGNVSLGDRSAEYGVCKGILGTPFERLD